MGKNKKVADMTPEERERKNASSKKWRDNNLEKVRAINKKYCLANLDKVSERNRRFKAENPGYLKQWRLDNPEKYEDQKLRAQIKQQEKYRNDPEYRKAVLDKQKTTAFCCHGGQTQRERIPQVLIDEVRLKCFEMGLDPGIRCHILQAIIAVQTKYLNMGQAGDSEYHWLHPDDMEFRARSWAGVWRKDQRLRDNFHVRNKVVLDYICQASNHDEP